ncbi:MAG: sigma-70 family RNA polymerase sigma factor [Planctomycetes bacterium]|nr:sigma-70 family RNA polymerase sigma factor [Planctomycetota bacterium]
MDVPLSESLLRQSAFLDRLARGLVAGEAEAQDLVQDTWLAALRHGMARVSPRGFLATIARNRARNRARDAARRRRHEAAAARAEWTIPTDEVVAREEARRLVSDALVQLEEPYRSTLVLHFLEDLSAAEIARRAGVPAATVRSRVHRGLGLLRDRLDQRHGGDRRRWLLALAPLLPPAAVAGALPLALLLTMKTKLLLAAGAAAALFLAWMLLPDGLEASPSAAPSASGAPPVGAVEPLPRAAGAGSAAGAATRTAVAERPEPARSLVVHAVRKDDGTPVAGATLTFVASDPAGWIGEVDMAEARVAAQGQQVECDAEGRALVPRPGREQGYWVFARCGALWGAAVVQESGAQPVRVELEPDRTVTVRVVDAQAVPVAGARVVLAQPDAKGNLRYSARTGRTGADGIARFAHAQAQVHGESDRRRLAVGVDLPLPERVQAPVDLERLPAEPIELRVPAHGALVLRFVDEGGAPFTPPEVVQVEVRVDGGTQAADRSHTVVTSAGETELFPFGVGLQCRVVAESESFTTDAAVAGPTRPGERRVADVPIRRRPVLTGRLVDERRAPLPHATFSITHVANRPGSWVQREQTDAGGRFRVPVPPLFGSPMAGRVAVFARAEERAGDERAVVPLRGIGEDHRVHDLGDVVLAAPPILLQGTVVDAAGAPVAGATLHVQDEDGGTRWEASGVAEVQSDAAGCFTLRGAVGTSFPRVSCRKDPLPAYSANFQPGTVGHRIVLRSGGAIRLPVRLPEGVDPALFHVTCADAAGVVETWSLDVRLRAGIVEWDGLAPGPVRVEVRGAGGSEPLARRSGQVVAGTATALEVIDLGQTHAFTITVLDAQGAPIPEAVAWLDPDQVRQGTHSAARAFTGRLTLRAAAPSVDVAVTAPGYGIRVVRGLRGDAEVRLPPGLTVDLDVDGPEFAALAPLELTLVPAEAAAQPDDGHRFFWAHADPLVVVRGDLRALAASRAALRAPGTVRLRVPEPGRYRVRIVADPEQLPRRFFPASGTVTVGPDGGRATVRWRPDEVPRAGR